MCIRDRTTSIDDLNMLQRAQLLWGLLRDDRISPWLRRLGPMAILAYVLSPIDLIPDFILGPGQVDDLGVIAVGMVLLLRLLARFAPDAILSEHLNRIVGGPKPPERDAARDTDETIE